jgi:hypothetical protein
MVKLGTKKYVLAKKARFQDKTYIVEQAFPDLASVEFLDNSGQVWKIFQISDSVWGKLVMTGVARCRQGNRIFVLTIPTNNKT